jgi:hypothetical protein
MVLGVSEQLFYLASPAKPTRIAPTLLIFRQLFGFQIYSTTFGSLSTTTSKTFLPIH